MKTRSPPSRAAVTRTLGQSRRLWDMLRRHVVRDFAPITEDWVFGGEKHGWALRLKHKKHALLYLKPLEGSFRASLALGPRAVEAARVSALPRSVMRLIDEAIEYPEGKAIRIDIHGAADIRIATQLAAIKLEATQHRTPRSTRRRLT